ncbi:paraquat-inducible protein A [Psychromonas sp. psych-6C06]|uniref:paraquat-inducible protein A n=1 Tax=Psychromonas sp. psych-6C06 TaxID=2058089 RepID=UPI001EE72A46|nr:paraquat-inducible protein A [Psychromonas sp. psych-6C06]
MIYKNSWCNPSGMLALCLTALIITIPAFNLPLISLHLLGITEETNLLQGVFMMIDSAPIVSFVVLFCAVIAPTLLIISIAISSACLSFNLKLLILPKLFKITRILIHWSMLEVYMVSLMVAMFKLMNYADLYIGTGFYFFIALLLINTTVISNYSNHQYWERYSRL